MGAAFDLNASLAARLAEILFHRRRERWMQIEHILALTVAAFVEFLVHRGDEARLGLLERDAVLRRLGPASDGSMLPSSSLSTSVKIGSSVVLTRYMPCALAYAATRSIRAWARAVSVRYWIVSSSIGKKPQVAPYSGAML